MTVLMFCQKVLKLKINPSYCFQRFCLSAVQANNKTVKRLNRVPTSSLTISFIPNFHDGTEAFDKQYFS